MTKITRLLNDPPKGGYDRAIKTPNGFWARLLNDNDNTDKLEDSHPFNTFVEILLAIIAAAVSISAILDGILAARELFGK